MTLYADAQKERKIQKTLADCGAEVFAQQIRKTRERILQRMRTENTPDVAGIPLRKSADSR